MNQPDYLAISGSHLYGVATSDSDMDKRGFFLPPVESVVGLGLSKIDQYTPEGEDTVLWSLEKFLVLTAKGNTQGLEILFAPQDQIEVCTEIGSLVLKNRGLLISKKFYHSIKGFVNAEKRRMTGQSLQYVTKDEKKIQAVENFISTLQLRRYERDEILSLVKDFTGEDIMGLSPQRDVVSPRRVTNFEKYGYDVKAAYHVFRLLIQGLELAVHGQIIYPSDNKAEMKNIREGCYTLNQFMHRITDIEDSFDRAFANSNLPEKADMNKINALYLECLRIREYIL